MTVEEHLARWYRQSEQVAPVRVARLNRKRLVQLFGEWGLRRGAEIGVDGGTFSRFMFDSIPGLELLGVDPWQRNPAKERQAEQLLEGRAWSKVHGLSRHAADQVEDGSLDFVYIDGDHRFDAVILDLVLWAPKVRPGGIVAGHDYYRFRGAGVVPAVDVYTAQHRVSEWFLTDEKTASFFWLSRGRA